MEFIVMSDSHGNNQAIEQIIADNPQASFFIHCGDICQPTALFPRLICVRGNNDYDNDLPNQRTVDLSGLKTLVIHSHQVSSFNRYANLIKKAKNDNCQLVCFGHTHVWHYSNEDGITLLNPGSCWLSRNGDLPSYAKCKYENGKLEVERVELI